MIRVNLSVINAVGYEKSTRRIRITLEQGHSYDFCGVPLLAYETLMGVTS